MNPIVKALEPILLPVLKFLNRHFWVAKVGLVLVAVLTVLVWGMLAVALIKAV